MNPQTIFESNQTHMTLFSDSGETIFEEEIIENFQKIEYEEVSPYLELGSTFIRKYTIEKFLGEGALGIAYVAQEEGSGNRVVIKEFFPKGIVKRNPDCTVTLEEGVTEHELQSYEKMKRVFEEEAQNIVTINTIPHKNVVGFVSLEREINNTIYYLMPYVEGEELGVYLERLKKEGHIFSQKEICNLVEPILDGLSHIHHYGVYHKDIKPANIYMRKDDEPMLIDFGASVTSAHLMTPSYAPVEQIKRLSSEIGPYTDLYALGVMVYELILGKKPPSSKLRAEVIGRGDRDPYTPLVSNRILRERFERHFLKAIDHALAFSYCDRPQSAKVFKEELRGEVARKKRNRLLGFFFLALVGFGTLAYALYEHQRDKFAYLIVPNGEHAQVLVDNKIVPPQLDGRYKVLLGNHMVEIKNGSAYLPKVVEVTLEEEGVQKRVENPLVKKELSFEVRTQKDLVAEVYIDGEFVGKTPYRGKFYYESLDKEYKITLRKEGYDDASIGVLRYGELMRKDNNRFLVALRKKEGSVEIKSPVGFKVKINGRLIKDKNGRIEITPLAFKRPPGVYTVLLYSSKREQGVRVYEHIVRQIKVEDKKLTLFPQVKAVKSKRYLELKARQEEEKRVTVKEQQQKVLKEVKAPKMGKSLNGVSFAKTEVTYDELVRFLNAKSLSEEVLSRYFELRLNTVSKYIKREDGHFYVFKGYEDYPVVQISWEGANAYIEWLNAQTGRHYRLPTQKEWEAVAALGKVGIVEGRLAPVATKRANVLGLYDIFGNVAEWGQDDFGEFSKVVLGGSFRTLKEYMQANMYNGMNKKSHKHDDIGFRVVQ